MQCFQYFTGHMTRASTCGQASLGCHCIWSCDWSRGAVTTQMLEEAMNNASRSREIQRAWKNAECFAFNKQSMVSKSSSDAFYLDSYHNYSVASAQVPPFMNYLTLNPCLNIEMSTSQYVYMALTASGWFHSRYLFRYWLPVIAQ